MKVFTIIIKYIYINEYEYKKYLCMISMTTAMMKSGLYYY